MALESIMITQFEERHAPPSDEVLTVAVVGEDEVFLTVSKHNESNTTLTLDHVSQVSVSFRDLFSAMQLLQAASMNEIAESISAKEIGGLTTSQVLNPEAN